MDWRRELEETKYNCVTTCPSGYHPCGETFQGTYCDANDDCIGDSYCPDSIGDSGAFGCVYFCEKPECSWVREPQCADKHIIVWSVFAFYCACFVGVCAFDAFSPGRGRDQAKLTYGKDGNVSSAQFRAHAKITALVMLVNSFVWTLAYTLVDVQFFTFTIITHFITAFAFTALFWRVLALWFRNPGAGCCTFASWGTPYIMLGIDSRLLVPVGYCSYVLVPCVLVLRANALEKEAEAAEDRAIRDADAAAAAEAAKPGSMRVRVAGLSGAETEVFAEPSTTVAQLKQKLHGKQGVRPECQALTHAGALLNDASATLKALGIEDGARLHLVVLSPEEVSESESSRAALGGAPTAMTKQKGVETV